jgi:hypothetical protein
VGGELVGLQVMQLNEENDIFVQDTQIPLISEEKNNRYNFRNNRAQPGRWAKPSTNFVGVHIKNIQETFSFFFQQL